MMVEQESLTIRVPKDMADRVRAMAASELTQPASVWRRIMKVGIETEEVRLEAESLARRAPLEAVS